jgi:hypothetical protein
LDTRRASREFSLHPLRKYLHRELPHFSGRGRDAILVMRCVGVVVVCRCVRFGICSGAAPAGFGIDHPVSGGRRLAGHYPFCVSLSVRAVTCTRRVACLFSSASRACGLPFWGDMGVRACVRAASSRVSCRRRVRACAAWRPFSLLRGVAPVRAASLHFPNALSCRRSIGARRSWDTCLGLRVVW